MANAIKKPIESVADYLKTLSAEQRIATEKLIDAVKSGAPQMQLGLSYSTPSFKVKGKPAIGVAAAKAHIGLYVMSEAVMKDFSKELANMNIAKGCIRFSFTDKLPEELIKKIVKARVAEMNK